MMQQVQPKSAATRADATTVRSSSWPTQHGRNIALYQFPGGLPAEDAPGDHGPCQHHHDPGPVPLHLYPGEMDRYADRLGTAAEDAAEDTGKAKIRPDDDEDEDEDEDDEE